MLTGSVLLPKGSVLLLTGVFVAYRECFIVKRCVLLLRDSFIVKGSVLSLKGVFYCWIECRILVAKRALHVFQFSVDRSLWSGTTGL